MFDNQSASYQRSAIRTYLNGDFITTYGLSIYYMKKVDFTSSIETTEVSDEGSDYVFLLSKTEAENTDYFADASARIARNASNETSNWWLRSNVEYQNLSYCVKESGEFYGDYSSASMGVRPAFWYTWN